MGTLPTRPGFTGAGRRVQTMRALSKVMTTCCPTIADLRRLGCQEHGWDCPDVIVQRQDDGSFIIPNHDGGESAIGITYCPWCGTVLFSLN